MTRPGGFTLVETVVGLLLASLAVTISAQILIGVSDGLTALTRDANRHERRALAHVWLADALQHTATSASPPREFFGKRDSLSFYTKRWVPTGWREEARAVVRVRDGRLTLSFEGETPVLLLDSLAGGEFDFTGEFGAAAPWLAQWTSYTEAPRLVRLRVGVAEATDTLLWYVGGR